jgi:hypothetical protein
VKDVIAILLVAIAVILIRRLIIVCIQKRGTATLSAHGSASGASTVSNPKPDGADLIDYEMAIPLDAESLAETGMKEAYEELQRQSGDIGVKWAPMRELWDGQDEGYDGGENYRLEVSGKIYPVFGSAPTNDPWSVATATFFDVVNSQLSESPFKFYGVNAGNDLHVVRLTAEEFEEAKLYHKGSPYCPYLPDYLPPKYGFPN